MILHQTYLGKQYFQQSIFTRQITKYLWHNQTLKKTAIISPFGLFEFSVMTFGLRNAAQTFQRFIYHVLRGLDFAFPYLDDILVASSTPEKHIEDLRTVFERLDDDEDNRAFEN